MKSTVRGSTLGKAILALAFALVIILIASVTAGAGPKDSEAERLKDQAQDALFDGEWEGAAALYEQSLALDVSGFTINDYRGLFFCYQKAERTAEEIGAYLRAIANLQGLGQSYQDLWIDLGGVYLESGDPQKALDSFMQVPEAERNSTMWNNGVFNSYVAMGRLHEAIALVDSLIKKGQPDSFLQMGLVRACIDGGLLAEAENACYQAIALYGRDNIYAWRFYGNLVEIYEKQGMPENMLVWARDQQAAARAAADREIRRMNSYWTYSEFSWWVTLIVLPVGAIVFALLLPSAVMLRRKRRRGEAWTFWKWMKTALLTGMPTFTLFFAAVTAFARNWEPGFLVAGAFIDAAILGAILVATYASKGFMFVIRLISQPIERGWVRK